MRKQTTQQQQQVLPVTGSTGLTARMGGLIHRATNGHSTDVQTCHPRSPYRSARTAVCLCAIVIRAYGRLLITPSARGRQTPVRTDGIMNRRPYARITMEHVQTAVRTDQYGARTDGRTNGSARRTYRPPQWCYYYRIGIPAWFSWDSPLIPVTFLNR